MRERITIMKDGRSIEVTPRAYDVVYRHHGYKLGSGSLPPITDRQPAANEVVEEPQVEEENFYDLTVEQLEKKKKDELTAFLDDQGVTYNSSDTKAELIKLIKGE